MKWKVMFFCSIPFLVSIFPLFLALKLRKVILSHPISPKSLALSKKEITFLFYKPKIRKVFVDCIKPLQMNSLYFIPVIPWYSTLKLLVWFIVFLPFSIIIGSDILFKPVIRRHLRALVCVLFWNRFLTDQVTLSLRFLCE